MPYIGDEIIRNIPEQVADNSNRMDALEQRMDSLNPEAVAEEVVAVATPIVVASALKTYRHFIKMQVKRTDESIYSVAMALISNDPTPIAVEQDTQIIDAFYNYFYKGQIRYYSSHSGADDYLVNDPDEFTLQVVSFVYNTIL